MYTQFFDNLFELNVAMERDSINWAKGRGLLLQPFFLTSDTPFAVMKLTLLLGTKGGLRNHEEVSQDQSRPFRNGSFRESKEGKSPNTLPEGPIASCGSASLTGS